MQVTDSIRYVGVNDHQVDLFEGQYQVPNGMSYNSYVILDEKVAVMDTVDIHFGEEWMANVKAVLAGRTPDYLIVQHMEPDHSANISRFLEEYPQATVVATAKAFVMMKQFFGNDYADRRIVASEMSELSLGAHTLHFVMTPMVHWPEVMVTYESSEKVLFSADGFGKFGALDCDEPWDDEARRYYIGIVGKYGVQVQALLKKAAALDIAVICPLHGPVLTSDLSHYVNLYQLWSTYTPEKEAVVIAYASVYGNTKEAALLLADILREKGKEVHVYDLARCDMSQAVADAFCCSSLVLASITYNADCYPCMKTFINQLVEHNYQKRTVGFIENGSWAPMAAKVMQKMLEGCKNLTMAEPVVTVRGAVTKQAKPQIKEQMSALAAELE
ncbi:MAG: FprA family A-type flavoprotein [Lachnospiraceae bacterium]